jgi:hypothetical protein
MSQPKYYGNCSVHLKNLCHPYLSQTHVPCIIFKSWECSVHLSPLGPISRVSQHIVFLPYLFVPSHQLCVGFVHEQTFQMWYYRKITHHLGRHSLLGTHPLNVAWIISRGLIPTCFAYWTGIQIFILLTMIEDAIIRTRMYLLCF